MDNFFIKSHFTNFQLISFLAAGLSGFLSILLFSKGKYNWSIAVLFLTAIIIRFTMAAIDPFLNLWDEQYHALVAKNMMSNPFKPMLIVNPVLPYDVINWAGNHIWLHKQPLFLWQIALSFKIFGVNEFALRLPSAIMSALCVLLIYRIGKNLTNQRIAFCGALFFTFSNFQIEIATGSMNTDHNDMAFMFYINASIWAWTEYMLNKRLKWALVIGLFSGMAILVKWLPGLIVYSGWGLAILSDKECRTKILNYRNILISFISAIIIMAPWQIYKSITFPVESEAEARLTASHFTEAVEGHGGNMWFYIDLMNEQYGVAALFLILPAFFFLGKAMRNSELKNGIFTIIILFLLFFTIAATKMPLFCIPLAPLFFLALGALIEKVISFSFIPQKKTFTISVVILSLASFFYLDIRTLELKHSNHNPAKDSYRAVLIHNMETAKAAARLLPSKKYIVFNCRSLNAILMMFYSGNTAYDWIPDQNSFADLKHKGLKIAVFADEKLPDYLANDKEVLKMDLQFISY